jgi:hypothetical protein
VIRLSKGYGVAQPLISSIRIRLLSWPGIRARHLIIASHSRSRHIWLAGSPSRQYRHLRATSRSLQRGAKRLRCFYSVNTPRKVIDFTAIAGLTFMRFARLQAGPLSLRSLHLPVPALR